MMTLEELKGALAGIEARPVTEVLIQASWSGELPGSNLFNIDRVSLDTESYVSGPVVHLECEQKLLADE